MVRVRSSGVITEFIAQSLGLKVCGLGFMVQGKGYITEGVELKVDGLGSSSNVTGFS